MTEKTRWGGVIGTTVPPKFIPCHSCRWRQDDESIGVWSEIIGPVHCDRCGRELTWRLSAKVCGSKHEPGPDPLECKPGGIYHRDTKADYHEYTNGVVTTSYGRPLPTPR